MSKIVILVIIVFGIGVGIGYLLGFRTQDAGRRSSTIQTIIPSPSPSPSPKPDEKFENIKAEVKFADSKKFTYTQDGKDKTLTDLTGITVWKSIKEGDKPSKMDWNIVKAGTKVQLASEKATGKIVAVLVL